MSDTFDHWGDALWDALEREQDDEYCGYVGSARYRRPASPASPDEFPVVDDFYDLA